MITTSCIVSKLLLLSLLLVMGALADTTTASANDDDLSFNVRVAIVQSWTTLRENLRYKMCSSRGSCLSSSAEKADMYLAADAPTTSGEFTVFVGVPWILYQAVGLPSSLLEEMQITSLVPTGALPTITDRGTNLVQLSTVAPRPSSSRYWFNANSLVSRFVRVISLKKITSGGLNWIRTNDIVLVSCSCTSAGTRTAGYTDHCTWIYAMPSVSMQVEVSGLDWSTLNPLRNTNIVGQSPYPDENSVKSATKGMENRVEFDFTYNFTVEEDTFDSSTPHIVPYLTFGNFILKLDEAMENVRPLLTYGVQLHTSHLVESTATVNTKTNTSHQQFTVSFQGDDGIPATTKILCLVKLGKLNVTDVNLHSVNSESVPGSCKRWGPHDDSDYVHNEPSDPAFVVIGIVAAVTLLSFGIAALIMMKKKSNNQKSKKIEEDEKEEQLLATDLL